MYSFPCDKCYHDIVNGTTRQCKKNLSRNFKEVTIKLRSKGGKGIIWRRDRKLSDLGTSQENRWEGIKVLVDTSGS